MSERLRQFLVIMLMGLQMAAPLVHAHAGRDVGQQMGLHLHELERFSEPRLAAEYQTANAADLFHEVAVVDIDYGIKGHRHLHVDVSSTVLWLWHALGFAVALPSEIIGFSPHRQLRPVAPVPDHQTSRSPPLTLA